MARGYGVGNFGDAYYGVTKYVDASATASVSASVTTYALAYRNVDVLEVGIKRDDTDLQLERNTMEEYLKIPRKGQTGRP